MFSKILIANRGEIACRVISTARRMGIRTVAVYSDADAGARHVDMADEAYGIGPAPARQSYLRGDDILLVARRAGAEAIHPGYGFLSENADFAEECAAAGMVFIGPRPAAIRAMGSKSAAKQLMEQSGVPLVPGYHGADQSPALLQAEAHRIGYPVLLKASAGGGGKGMRVVEASADFADALARAKGEARASFGDDHMLVEKYLTRPRHIEVQVFGDTHGNIVSLFERDCSIQRRHQKVIEESPAPFITPAQRASLGAAAIAAARAVDYVGAGTVEFIYEDERFYFMEMNTRLQVEHPVTEFVTGLDLVEWQLRVASGEVLPLSQAALSLRGHAIEARICAEDPARDFMPATGLVTHLRLPETSPDVRVDTGIRQGDVITPYYDSMIAKLIVWGEDREAARRRLAGALESYELVGPATNLTLLRRIAGHDVFRAATIDTGFIPRYPALLAAPALPGPQVWAAAALAWAGAACAPDGGSPWAQADGWRLNAAPSWQVTLRHGEGSMLVQAVGLAGGFWRLRMDGEEITARLHGAAGSFTLQQERSSLGLGVLFSGPVMTVLVNGENYPFAVIDPCAPPAAAAAADTRLVAPIPARVAQLFVHAGMRVKKGEKLLILEAMKMETIFTAPRDGEIETVHVRQDELVQEGAQLVGFKPDAVPEG